MAELKVALTYEQQIERLKTFHNVLIEDDAEALSILKTINYYRLSAYGIGLTKPGNHEEYVDGTSLKSLYRLYNFDSKFKNALIHVIEQIEIQLRAQISNFLALKYGSEGYINPNNFVRKSTKEGVDIHTSVINHFKDECSRQGNAPLVKHHMTKYDGHFPIWVAVELFTFGNLSSLYDIMFNEDRKEIAKFYSTEPNYLGSWILALLEVRNICAHYSRLYNMPLKQTPFLYREHRQFRQPINKVFPVLLIIKRMLLNNKLWNEFFDLIQGIFKEYSDVVKLSYIGFPKNWVEVLKG